MAKTKQWWPKTIALQLAWWTNILLKMVTYTTELVITTEERDQLTADAAMFKYLFTHDTTVRTYIAAFMKYRKDILAGKIGADLGDPPVMPITLVPASVFSALLNRTFGLVNSFKLRGGYTESIGKDMLIIGEDIPAFDPETYVANGKGKTTFDGNIIKFTKGVFIEGMGVFCQRGTNPDFIELIRITKTGYLDNRLNLAKGPESRVYYLRALIGDTFVGEPSPTFTLTWTSPPPPPPVV